MGSRSTSRRLAMQAMYQAEITSSGVKEALEQLFADEDPPIETIKFAEHLALKAYEYVGEADALISGKSKNWTMGRINALDKSILRLAIYELFNEKDTPKAVVIDEALELAKRYSDEKSIKFVNGILGSIEV